MSYDDLIAGIIKQAKVALINVERDFKKRDETEAKRMAKVAVKECKEIQKLIDEYFAD